MKLKLFFPILTLFFLINFSSHSQTDSSYHRYILSGRATKDSLFITSHSPLEKTRIKGFKGLNYFPVDEHYKITATFIKTKNRISLK